MTNDEKDKYFQLRDQFINSLPDPGKSIYGYFRKVERSNLKKHGRLIVSGKTPIEVTADHYKLSVAETKKICQNASNTLKNLARNE